MITKKCIAALIAAVTLLTSQTMLLDSMAVFAAQKKVTFISKTKARNIALDDAKVKSSKTHALDVDDDRVSGKKVFIVNFYVHNSGQSYTSYRYTIAARNGQIMKKSKKASKILQKKRAIAIALDHKDFRRRDVEDIDCDLDDEDGTLVYYISFSAPSYYVNDSWDIVKGNDYDFEYTINAVSGKIIDWDYDD